MKHERTVTVGSDHPAIAGHFPGYPVVPGVVVLDEVIESLQELYERSLTVIGLPSVKLSSPLNPGEALTITVESEDSGCAMFVCRAGSRLIASGSIQFRRAGDARATAP